MNLLKKEAIIGFLKRNITFICVVVFLAASYAGCMAFAYWIDEPMYPKIPMESSPGKIILTSRGCCFWAEDVTVSLLDGYGNKTAIISQAYVYEYDIFECEDIPDIDTPVEVIMDFRSMYAEEEIVSFSVGEFENTDAILKKGLLLRFGDYDLIVRAGKVKKLFSGVGRNKPWKEAE